MDSHTELTVLGKLAKCRIVELSSVLNNIGLSKTGRKDVLIDRIMSALKNFIVYDPNKYQEIMTLIEKFYCSLALNKSGYSVSTDSSMDIDSHRKSSGVIRYTPYSYSKGKGAKHATYAPLSTVMLNSTDVEFSSIPFLKMVTEITAPFSFASPTDEIRTTTIPFITPMSARASITIAKQRLYCNSKDFPPFVLLLRCKGYKSSNRSKITEMYPPNVVFEINGERINCNTKSSYPNIPYGSVDVTSVCLISGTNNLVLRAHKQPVFSKNSFVVTVHLMKHCTAMEEVQLISTHSRLPRATVISRASEMIATQQDLGCNDEFILPLRDPLLMGLMTYPARGKHCKHLQCFDALSYLQMNERLPQWKCPVCSQLVKLDEVEMDEFFLDVIKERGRGDDAPMNVIIEPSGEWRMYESVKPVYEAPKELTPSQIEAIRARTKSSAAKQIAEARAAGRTLLQPAPGTETTESRIWNFCTSALQQRNAPPGNSMANADNTIDNTIDPSSINSLLSLSCGDAYVSTDNQLFEQSLQLSSMNMLNTQRSSAQGYDNHNDGVVIDLTLDSDDD